MKAEIILKQFYFTYNHSITLHGKVHRAPDRCSSASGKPLHTPLSV